MNAIWRRLDRFLRRRRFEAELEEEMRLHRELRAERLRIEGVSPSEAASRARRQFGNFTRLRELSRETWTWQWLDTLSQDIRYGARILRQKPGFTAIAALTLALGIGANTAVFSIVHAVLLQPLPYQDPQHLVVIWDVEAKNERGMPIFASFHDFEQFRRYAHSFSSISAATWAGAGRVWTHGGISKNVLALPATADFFATLGVQAALGRTFGREDEKQGACAVVLSHGFWKEKFHSDATAAGKTITLDDQLCNITGVMPEKFSFYPRQAQMWRLVEPHPKERPIVGVFARLKPGVTVAQAQAEVGALHRSLHLADKSEKDVLPAVFNLQDEFTMLAGPKMRETIWLLAGAVLLVLLIACLNVANLLLSRSLARARELAVRTALGCSRGRIVRQLLTEALLLAWLGAIPGVCLALVAVHVFGRISPIELPVGAEVEMNLPVIAFCLALSMGTTLLFGLLPAVRGSRLEVNQTLKAAGRNPANQGGRQVLAKTMVTAEMTLSVMLLTGAGLLLNSLLRMNSADLGYEPRHLIYVSTTLQGSRYGGQEQRANFYRRLQQRLQEIGQPIAISSNLPLYGDGRDEVEIDGKASGATQSRAGAGVQSISPEFFDVFRTHMISGRGLDQRDRADSEPAAVINAALASRLFPDGQALGKRIRLKESPVDRPHSWWTIVGVVANQKYLMLLHEMSWTASPVIFRPLAQDPTSTAFVVGRTARGELGRQLQNAIAEVDRAVPAGDVETVEAGLSRSLSFPRFRAILLGSFALTAILLAAVGLHGVLSQLVSQRIPEFGVRMAVGARAGDLFALVAKQGGWPVLGGLVLGLGSAWALQRVLATFLYGAVAVDPLILAGALLLLFLSAGGAIFLPARRASRVDPAIALRHE